MQKDPYGKAVVAETPLPTFTYKVLAADAGPVAPDPVTGLVTPGHTIEKIYRLVGNIVQRVAPPGYKDQAEAHPVAEAKKDKAGKKKREQPAVRFLNSGVLVGSEESRLSGIEAADGFDDGLLLVVAALGVHGQRE